MTMIAMNSKNQLGYLFNNNYPQPLKIEKNSEICLQKFVHSRDKENFYITTENNEIGFVIGSDKENSLRTARIQPGRYTAAQLTTAINQAFANINQQQNFGITITQVANPPPSDTTRTFTITYDALAAVNFNITGGLWTRTSVFTTILNDDTIGGKSRVQIGDPPGSLIFEGATLEKGIITHGGTYDIENIAPNPDDVYGNFTCGLVRNQTSQYTATSPILEPGKGIGFAPGFADMVVEFGNGGDGTNPAENFWIINMVSYDFDPTLDYETQSWRRKQNLGLIRQSALEAFLDPASTGNRTEDNLRLTFRILQDDEAESTTGNFMIQLSSAPLDDAENYTFMPDSVGGNYTAPDSPANGLPIVRTETIGAETYPGVIFWSKDSSYISVGADGDIQGRALTAYAPWLPFVAINGFPDLRAKEGYLGLPAGNTWLHSGGGTTSDYDDVGQTEYWDYREVVSNGNIRYWRHLGTSGHATNPTGHWGRWYSNNEPTDFSTPPNETWTADHITGVLTRASGIQTFTPSGVVPIVVEPRQFRLTALSNLTNTPIERSFANAKYETATRPYIDLGNVVASTNPNTTDAPPDTPVIKRSITLYLDKVFQGEPIGTMGRALGYDEEETEHTDQQAVYVSEREPEGTSKNTTLHISLAELNNIRSFEGGILDTQDPTGLTTNYDANGDITNTIAIIPRNEFSTIESTTELAFVAPYENWVKLNNNTDVLLNQLTLQVRDADGNLSTDLLPETQAVFKVRRSPEDLQTEMIRGIVDKLGAQQTDQITFTAS